MGEKDEWLSLEQEDYYMYELGEREDDEAAGSRGTQLLSLLALLVQ